MKNHASLGHLVAADAQRIVENARHTKYRHDIYIDEASGTYDVDCSGFLSYILGHVAPHHLDAIPLSASETRLLAHDYFNFFASLPAEITNGWRRIPHLSDARCGDLIAWALPQVDGKGDTGHCFMVAEQPVAVDATTMAVTAYDASDILHYDDSRGPDPNPIHTGVGSGVFHLQIDVSGTPVAFQFGPGDPIIPDGIAIGRIEGFDA
jgi:hypothetical protein